jgi:hypothetical protein
MIETRMCFALMSDQCEQCVAAVLPAFDRFKTGL